MQKILLADANAVYRNHLARDLRQMGYHTMAAGNGMDLMELARQYRPDCVLVDPVLPQQDGLTAAEELNRGAHVPFFIFHSAAFNELLYRRAYEMNAEVIAKPSDAGHIHTRISARRKHVPIQQQFIQRQRGDVFRQSAQVLLQLGARPKHTGYALLLSAVYHTLQQSNDSKNLYRFLAMEHNKKPEGVERSIRYCIEFMFEKGNLEMIERMFGYSIDMEKGKPTNLEFIARVADDVYMQMM